MVVVVDFYDMAATVKNIGSCDGAPDVANDARTFQVGQDRFPARWD